MDEKDIIIQYIEEQCECEWVDFKEKFYLLKNDKDSFIKDIVSFANNRNQKDKYIIFGVEDKSRTICGVSPETIPDVSTLEDLLFKKVEPQISIRLGSLDFDKRLIVFIKIPASNEKLPYIIKNECGSVKQGDIYIRKGSINVKATRRDLDDIYINSDRQKIVPYDDYIIVEPIHIKGTFQDNPTYGIMDIQIMNLSNKPLLINNGWIEIYNVFGKIERSVRDIIPNRNIQEHPFEVPPNTHFTNKIFFDFSSADCITLHFDDNGHLTTKTYVKTIFEDINSKIFESEVKEFFITAKGDILHKIKLKYKEFRLYLNKQRKAILKAIELNQDTILKQVLDNSNIDFSLLLPTYALGNPQFPEYDICAEMIRTAHGVKSNFALELMLLKGLPQDFVEFSLGYRNTYKTYTNYIE